MPRALWFCGLVLLTACGQPPEAPPRTQTSAPAITAASDLAADPAVRTGVLGNGLRYALMRSAQPPGKLSLRLRIASGSLQETDAQRGLAHYLEHMAFNGSAHFPAGELVPRLEKAGIGFGSHSNAHTSYDETVYQLDLPDLRPETLDLGLDVLADQAGRLLLAPAEVERERGVILAEMRDRDSPGYRIALRRSQAIYAGTRLPERMPIGIAATIQAADAALLRDYYATWYRPERMLLAAVGDLDPAVLEPRLRAAFGDLAAGAARPDPGIGTLNPGEAGIAIHEAEEDGTSVWFGRIVPRARPADGREVRRPQFQRDLAERIVARRLQTRIQAEPEGPLLSGACFSYQWQGLYQAGAGGAARPGKALAALAVLVEEWRRMAEHGPTPAEMDTERAAVRADLDRAVAQADARPNGALAGALLRADAQGLVFQSPVQERDLELALLAESTADSVRTAFAAGWMPGPGRTVAVVAGRDDLGADGDRLVLDALQQAWKTPVTAPVAQAAAAWAYAHTPDWQGEIPAPAADAICLAGTFNGISVQAKRTDFQPNQVLLRLRFHARTAPRHPALANWVQGGFQAGGLGRHSAAELMILFAGTSIRPGNVGIDDDGVTWDCSCLPDELGKALEAARAMIVDPGWRPDAETRVRTAWMQQLAAEPTDLQASVWRAFLGLSHPDQPWQRPATRDEVQGSGFAEARAWFMPILARAPLSVSVIGDIDPVTAVRLAAGHLGGTGRPPVPVAADAAAARAALPENPAPPVGEHRIAVAGTTARALILASWPGDDTYDIRAARRRNVLAAVLGERLRERLREDLGQAYSPAAWNLAGAAWRGQGGLTVLVTVAPDQADAALAGIRAIAAELREQGVSADRATRALEPTLRNLAATRRKNGYWMGSVLDRLAEQPFRLEWSRTMEADMAAITPAELSELARAMLGEGRELAVVGVCMGR